MEPLALGYSWGVARDRELGSAGEVPPAIGPRLDPSRGVPDPNPCGTGPRLIYHLAGAEEVLPGARSEPGVFVSYAPIVVYEGKLRGEMRSGKEEVEDLKRRIADLALPQMLPVDFTDHVVILLDHTRDLL